VTRLVIVGAGGHGRETLDVVDALNRIEPRYDVLGMVADRADAARLGRLGVRHLGSVDDLAEGRLGELAEPVELVLAIGDPTSRRLVAGQLEGTTHTYAAALVHPLASIGADVELGRGVMVAAGARITTNVRVGEHVQVNVNAVVSHDCTVADFATLSPGVLVNGSVSIGVAAFLGTGSVVTPGRSIGDDAVVAAGAVVVRDVPAGVTAVGVPARWPT
jgi:sugar O-acyltransferase (sialic acid O-acetyltransferase NeuD family)